MQSHQRLPRRPLSHLLLFLFLGFAVLFTVPFHIPVAPAISDSYTFGFNNRAALVLFVLFAAAFAYWSGGLGLVAVEAEDAVQGRPMSQRLLWVTLGITVAVTVTFWLAYRQIGAINEGSYMMDRLQHLAAGERPYRDFEFIYGPLVLYLPLWVKQIVGMPLIDAYYLAWAAEWIGGVYLLWLTVKWAAASSPRKNGIYLLAFLGFIFSTVSLGPNYTPFRFVTAPFFALLVWRTLKHYSNLLPAALVSLVGAAWVLFFSPEQGIAFCAGTLLFFLLFASHSRPGFLLALGALLAGQGLLVVLLLRSGLVYYMRGMAQGGYNLPLLPSLTTLLSLLLLLAAACVLSNSLRLRRPGGPLEYLILVSLCALPAAFGRCDAGHIFMNTVGAFIAAWTVLSYRQPAGKWMVWSYVASALFLPLALYQANNFFMYPVKVTLLSPTDPHPRVKALAEETLRRVLGPRRTAATLAKWRGAYPLPAHSDVPGGQVLLAPLGFPSTLQIGDLPPITNGRYRGLGNVMAVSEVQDKVEELRAHPNSLLLTTAANTCPVAATTEPPSAAEIVAEDRQKRRELFLNLLPFYVPKVRHRDDLLAPVCAYITAHYRPSAYRAPLVGAQVWERRPEAGH